MKKLIFMSIMGVAFVLAACSCAWSADGGALIDGPDYAFTLTAPKGWKLITTQELQAAFHPADTSFDKSDVVMYARSASKKELKIANVADLNRLDLAGIQKRKPDAKSEKIGAIKTTRGVEVPLYSFSGGGFNEIVGYVDEGKTISVLVISAEKPEQLKAARAAFDELVASYFFVTDVTKTTDKPAKAGEAKPKK